MNLLTKSLIASVLRVSALPIMFSSCLQLHATDTVLLADVFTDNNHTNQSLPESARWFYAGGPNEATRLWSTPPATSGELRMVAQGGIGSSAMALAYFTPSGSPRTIAAGESLTIEFTLRLDATADRNDNIRFGVFNSLGARPSADSGSGIFDDLYLNNHNGYQVALNTGAASSSFNVFRRNNQGSGSPFALGSRLGTDNAAPLGLLVKSAVPVRLVLTRSSEAGTSMNIAATVNGVTVTRTDSGSSIPALDCLGISFSDSALEENQNVVIDDVTISHATAAATPVVTTLLADAFADDERLTQSLPSSARWFYAGQDDTTKRLTTASIVPAQNLVFTPGGVNAMTFTYFTASGSPRSLAVGESLNVQANLRMDALVNFANGVRFGLFNSQATEPPPTSPADLDSTSTFNNYLGYSGWLNPGVTGGFNLYRRATVGTNPFSIATSTLLGAENPVTLGLRTSPSRQARLSFTVTRLPSGVRIESSINGRGVVRTDTTATTTSFDTFGLFVHGNALYSTAQVDLDNVTVIHIAPQPAITSIGSILSQTFEGAGWASASFAGTGTTGSVNPGEHGTINARGSVVRSGGIRLAVDSTGVNSPWSGALESGLLPVTNSETNLGKLTLAFDLLASSARPVRVRLETTSGTGVVSGVLERLILPHAPNAYQRFAFELSDMTLASGTFDPTAPNIKLSLAVEGGFSGPDAWPIGAHSLQLDNVYFARPAYHVETGRQQQPQRHDGSQCVRDNRQGSQRRRTGRHRALDGGRHFTRLQLEQQSVIFARRSRRRLGDIEKLPRPAPAHPAPRTHRRQLQCHLHRPRLQWFDQYDHQPELHRASRLPPAGHGRHPRRGRPRRLHRQGEHEWDQLRQPLHGSPLAPYPRGGHPSLQLRRRRHRRHRFRLGLSGEQRSLRHLQLDHLRPVRPQPAAPLQLRRYRQHPSHLLGGKPSLSQRNQDAWEEIGRISDGNGAILDTFLDTPYGSYLGRSLVANNLFYQNGGSGVHALKVDGADIVHNTAYYNSASPSLNYSSIYASLSNDIIIANNIIVAAPGEPINGRGSMYDPTYPRTTGVTFLNNLYHSADGSFSPYTEVSASGNITATSAAQVGFVDAAGGDFRLLPNSLALNAAAAATAIATAPRRDFVGRIRGASGIPAIGALEPEPTPVQPTDGVVRAYFTDGNGVLTAQQFPGTGGAGWVSAWTRSASATATTENSAPLSADTGNYLKISRTGDPCRKAFHARGRQPCAPSTSPRGSPSVSASTPRSPHLIPQPTRSPSPRAPALPWAGALTPPSSSAPLEVQRHVGAREWGVYDGQSDTTSYSVTRFRPTGVLRSPGTTYSVLVDLSPAPMTSPSPAAARAARSPASPSARRPRRSGASSPSPASRTTSSTISPSRWIPSNSAPSRLPNKPGAWKNSRRPKISVTPRTSPIPISTASTTCSNTRSAASRSPVTPASCLWSPRPLHLSL